MNVLMKNQLKFINQYFEVIGITTPDDIYYDEIKEREGIKLRPAKLSRSITPFKDLISLWQIYRILRNEKPVILHTQTPKAGTIGMIAGFLCGVPYRFHDVVGLPLLERKGFTRLVLNLVEKITYKCATKIYPNSHKLKEIILKNNFCRKDKIKVIGNGSSNGIDTKFFSTEIMEKDHVYKNIFRKENSIEENDFVFCFVGRIVKEKGIRELVGAFVKLYDEDGYKNIKLIVVGPSRKNDDPIDDSTDLMIRQHPGIRYVGLKKDIRPYLFISDIFVFPSYREGFPNVVLEAGAMNLPQIVSDINGCNEAIINGYNGIIVPPRNSTKLYQAMKYCLENPDDVTRMASISRQQVVQNYDQQMFHAKILDEYNFWLKKKI